MGQDADVQVVDQDQDVGAGVASPDADVVQAAVVSQRFQRVLDELRRREPSAWAVPRSVPEINSC